MIRLIAYLVAVLFVVCSVYAVMSGRTPAFLWFAVIGAQALVQLWKTERTL